MISEHACSARCRARPNSSVPEPPATVKTSSGFRVDDLDDLLPGPGRMHLGPPTEPVTIVAVGARLLAPRRFRRAASAAKGGRWGEPERQGRFAKVAEA